MRLWYFLMLPVVALLAGCSNPNFSEDAPETENLFAASAMRIHPIFTQVKDWSGDGKPDGVEVLLEFQDQFFDPTKAAGIVRFELYEYRKANPDLRGARATTPWIGSLVSYDDQRARWNRTSRTYSFQLAYPQIQPTHSYVLSAIFKPTTSSRRLIAQLVLPGQEESSDSGRKPTSQPALIPHL
jgi:hypothetical protein